MDSEQEEKLRHSLNEYDEEFNGHLLDLIEDIEDSLQMSIQDVDLYQVQQAIISIQEEEISKAKIPWTNKIEDYNKESDTRIVVSQVVFDKICSIVQEADVKLLFTFKEGEKDDSS